MDLGAWTAALRRHPLPVRTRFGHSLVLTYALPPAVLAPLVAPGLALDTYEAPDGTAHAFVAVGVVSALRLRPAGLPATCGRDYVLTGYRIITRFPTPAGRTMRGLQILRSDTDRPAMVVGGNLLTRYHYRLARIRFEATGSWLRAEIRSRDGHADLTVTADLGTRPAPLPPGSPFATVTDARRFAGPLPYTFSPRGADRVDRGGQGVPDGLAAGADRRKGGPADVLYRGPVRRRASGAGQRVPRLRPGLRLAPR